MDIVRKKLTPDDLSPPYLRYDPTNDVVQISGNNGGTWEDAPQLDPRTINQFPPLTTGDPQCDAAARMVAAIQDVVMALINAINGGAQYAALQGILMGWLAVFGFFFVLVALAALVLALFVAIGYAALYAAFNAFDWDELACKLRCFVDGDGRLSQVSLDEFKAMIVADYDSTQSAILNALLDLTGFGALNAFAATRTETGDCSGCAGCEWCYEWLTPAEIQVDWTLSNPTDVSEWYLAAFGCDLIYARMEYSWNGVDGGSGSNSFIEGSLSYGTNTLVACAPLSACGSPLEWSGVSSITAGMWFGINAANVGSGAVVTIDSIKLIGTGTRPAGWTGGHEC